MGQLGNQGELLGRDRAAGGSVPGLHHDTYVEELYQSGLKFFYKNTPADLPASFRCYKTAAEHGHAKAQTKLGMCYETGCGVQKDVAKAAEWYLKAAQQGEVVAQFSLGTMCLHGIGTQRNEAEAIRWFGLAAAQGDADSQYELDALVGNQQVMAA